MFFFVLVYFRVKELGPDRKKDVNDFVSLDDTPEILSPTVSSNGSRGNNADLALLCTHSVSTNEKYTVLSPSVLSSNPFLHI